MSQHLEVTLSSVHCFRVKYNPPSSIHKSYVLHVTWLLFKSPA